MKRFMLIALIAVTASATARQDERIIGEVCLLKGTVTHLGKTPAPKVLVEDFIGYGWKLSLSRNSSIDIALGSGNHVQVSGPGIVKCFDGTAKKLSGIPQIFIRHSKSPVPHPKGGKVMADILKGELDKSIKLEEPRGGVRQAPIEFKWTHPYKNPIDGPKDAGPGSLGIALSQLKGSKYERIWFKTGLDLTETSVPIDPSLFNEPGAYQWTVFVIVGGQTKQNSMYFQVLDPEVLASLDEFKANSDDANADDLLDLAFAYRSLGLLDEAESVCATCQSRFGSSTAVSNRIAYEREMISNHQRELK